MNPRPRIPSPLPADGSDSLPSDYQSPGHQSSRHVTNLIIASGCLIAGAFFLALTYYAVFGHRCRRRLRPPFAAADSGEGIGGGGFAEETHGGGLDEAAIASIAAHEFGVAPLLAGAGDCPVCLAEFRGGELVRLLPSCRHVFHLPCIDTWLRTHVSCPLCRAHVVADGPPETDASDLAVQPSEGEPEAPPSPFRFVVGAPSSCPPSRVPSDLGETEPVRRSVSLISFPPVAVGETEESSENSKDVGKHGGGSKEGLWAQQKGQLEIDKSQSSSGRGFLFAKYGRTRSSSILPLWWSAKCLEGDEGMEAQQLVIFEALLEMIPETREVDWLHHLPTWRGGMVPPSFKQTSSSIRLVRKS